MINKPIVPVKTSIRSALTIMALPLLISALLSACANISTVKIPHECTGAENKIAVVPVETGYKDAYVKKMNIQILFNEMTRAPDLDELTLAVLGDLINWHPEAALSEKISEELTKRGRKVIQISEIVPLPENIRHSSSAATKWYNPDTTIFEHSAIKNLYHPTAIMEVSFESIMIIGRRTLTVILVRAIDPNSNKVIARKRTVKTFVRRDYDFKDPNQCQQYVLNFKPEFEDGLAKALPKILDAIGL
ncbi:MAG TPA: hypothetical protein VEM15_16560 [Thermodesulfobacteriota bacterium]|nr:hypothetical protein [Thermodesulfobacteriota bacterium]